jgi:putative FmdB family regulatory protein
MPTYEYQCTKCGDVFEKFQSMTEPALTVCPKDVCARKRWGKGKVRRTIGGGAGIIFKGSGFYITDYRSESYKKAAKQESGTATSTSSGKTENTGGSEKPSPKTNGSKAAKPADH